MATGALSADSVDSRVTCCVCLEPYRGRRPKLLPCLHTLCLPCLNQLADRQAARALQVGGGQGSLTGTACTPCL